MNIDSLLVSVYSGGIPKKSEWSAILYSLFSNSGILTITDNCKIKIVMYYNNHPATYKQKTYDSNSLVFNDLLAR